MTKRMLSLLLALVMTLSLCVPALAADEFEAETVTEVEEQAPEAPAEPEAPEAEVVEEPAAEEAVEAPEIAMAIAEEAEDQPAVIATTTVKNVATLADLQEAIDDGEGDIITLKAAGFAVNSGLTIGRSVTIDMQGAQLTGTSQTVEITNGATVTLKSTDADTGANTSTKGDFLGSSIAFQVDAGATLILENVKVGDVTDNGTLTVNASGEAGAVSGTGVLNVYKNGTAGAVTSTGDITVTGGTITSISHATSIEGKIDLSDGAKVTGTIGLKDDTLTVKGDKTEITGLVTANEKDTITVEGGKLAAGIKCTDNQKVTIIVSGGEVNGGSSGAIQVGKATGSVTITGGKLVTTSSSGNVITADTADVAKGAVTYVISGGTFVAESNNNGAMKDATRESGFITGGVFVKSINAEKDGASSSDSAGVPPEVSATAEAAHFKDTGEDDYTEYTVVGGQKIIDTAKKLTAGQIVVLRGTLTLGQLASGVGVENWGSGTVTANNQTLNKGDKIEAKKGAFQVGTAIYESLTAALKGVTDSNNTIVLRQNYSMATSEPGSSTVEIKKNVTLDTNGHVLTVDGTKTITVTGTSDKPVTLKLVAKDGIDSHDVTGGTITLTNATLEITNNYVDSAIAGTGKVVVGKTAIVKSATVAAGALTVEDGGRINAQTSVTVSGDLTVNKGGKIETVTLTASGKGAKVTVAGEASGLNASGDNQVIDISGEVTGAVTVSGEDAKLDITGKLGAGLTVADSAATAEVNIKDGASVTGNVALGSDSGVLKGSISGGKFTGTVTATYKAAGSTFEIKGGKFDSEVKTQVSSSSAAKGISGGIFLKSTNASLLAATSGGYVADDTAVVDFTDPTSLPEGAKNTDYNLYTLVGDDAVKEAMAAALKGTKIEVQKGDLTLASVSDDLVVNIAASGANLKVGDVTFTNATSSNTIKGEEINKLVKLVAQAKAVIAKGGVLDEAMTELKNALDAVTPAAVAQSELAAKTTRLEDALKPYGDAPAAPDKTALNAAIAEADKLAEADYTADSWKVFKAALDEAKEVAADANAPQVDIDDALKALNDAKAALVAAPATKETLNAAITAAKAYKEADYTADSYKALQTAITNAQAIADKANASEAEIKGAIDALKAAENALVKKTDEPTVPPVPEKNGRVWEKAEDGTWYCYIDKVLQKSTWIYSKGGLWYYVDKDGKMLEGFQKIEGKWYFLQNNDNGGTRGTIVTSAKGWIYDDAIPGGCAYAINKRNTGHFGEITWTQAGGDFVNGHFVKGDPA